MSAAAFQGSLVSGDYFFVSVLRSIGLSALGLRRCTWWSMLMMKSRDLVFGCCIWIPVSLLRLWHCWRPALYGLPLRYLDGSWFHGCGLRSGFDGGVVGSSASFRLRSVGEGGASSVFSLFDNTQSLLSLITICVISSSWFSSCPCSRVLRCELV